MYRSYILINTAKSFCPISEKKTRMTTYIKAKLAIDKSNIFSRTVYTTRCYFGASLKQALLMHDFTVKRPRVTLTASPLNRRLCIGMICDYLEPRRSSNYLCSAPGITALANIFKVFSYATFHGWDLSHAWQWADVLRVTQKSWVNYRGNTFLKWKYIFSISY